MAEIQSQEVQRDVTYLVDPEIKYVSIVTRGANGVPFKVVKNDSGDNMQKVLHSIIAPKGTEPDAIKKAMGEELEGVVKLESGMESGAHVTFVQHPRDAFKADSLELFDIDKEQGIKGLRGVPISEEKNLIGKLFTKKQEVIIVDGDNVPALSKEETAKSMGWEMYDELYSMKEAIEGIMGQECGDAQAKIDMVNAVMANFSAFCTDACSVMKGAAFEIKKREAPAESPKETPVMKDEVVKTEVVEKSIDEKVADAVKSFKDEITSALKEITDSLTAKMDEVVAKSEASAASVAKMEEMVPAPVADDRVDPKQESAKKVDVFSGLLIKR